MVEVTQTMFRRILIYALGAVFLTAGGVRAQQPEVEARIAGLEGNAEYMSLLREDAQLQIREDSIVNAVERMKVCTCLNPLHTALAIFGCLLGHTSIAGEMADPDLRDFVTTMAYEEGMPVVIDPGVIEPKAFLEEVLTQRFPNPFIPDTPQRIATDTSQKVGIRFGETIKSWIATGRDLTQLKAIPLALAGWLRYLLAVDDQGKPFEVSADPLKEELQSRLAGIRLGEPESCGDKLRPILANASIFGLDLTQTPLAAEIENLFRQELAGPGAVRDTLHRTLAQA